MEFSEVSPQMELDDSISDDTNLAPSPPISYFSSPLPIFLPSLDPSESTFVDSETSVLVIPI